MAKTILLNFGAPNIPSLIVDSCIPYLTAEVHGQRLHAFLLTSFEALKSLFLHRSIIGKKENNCAGNKTTRIRKAHG